jgi:hypothetical protein
MEPQLENPDEMPYTPENLRSFADRIEDVRISMLLGINDTGSDPESDHYYLLALSALESAYQFMLLAAIKQSKIG